MTLDCLQLSCGGLLWAPAGRAGKLKYLNSGQGMHGGYGPCRAYAPLMGSADYVFTAGVATHIPPACACLQQKRGIIVSCADVG